MPNGFRAELAKYYFDTAQSYHPVPMRALKDTVPVSQILLGTDWPYRSVADTMNGIASVFSATELAAISGGNIRKLLPRFAA